MTLSTAKKHFESALAIAEQENDEFRQSIAAGLIALADALQQQTTDIKNGINTIKNSVK